MEVKKKVEFLDIFIYYRLHIKPTVLMFIKKWPRNKNSRWFDIYVIILICKYCIYYCTCIRNITIIRDEYLSLEFLCNYVNYSSQWEQLSWWEAVIKLMHKLNATLSLFTTQLEHVYTPRNNSNTIYRAK